MMNFILVVVFLCTFSWISVSVCQFNTVVVRPAEEVTLLCNDITTFVSHIWWFKMNSSPNISRISSMLSSGSNALLRDGFNFSKYTVTSNTTKMFLKIKDVNFSDSGLYFCGENPGRAPTVFTATYLQVEGKMDFLHTTVNIKYILLSVKYC
uniref:Immunoglobulin domain-containing protein n=1 Tax=Fundulus heteroclitus TaxID=8078 RepID=A0A3Q2NWF7_FUNHE